jgi:pimeloyl-ACP methyl ester carboxylesterase
VAAGPAILALRDARRDARPDFLVTIGAYYDLLRTLRFQMTGEYEHGGTRLSRHPIVHARWAFVLSELDRIADPGDRRALGGLAERRMAAADSDAGPAGVVPPLGPEGRAVLTFVENESPARFRDLFLALPRAVRDGVGALDLSCADLAGVDLPALLVHGRDDPVVPFPETRDLARALQVPDSRVFLIEGLGHVSDPGLRDALSLWRTVHTLLRLRDASP